MEPECYAVNTEDELSFGFDYSSLDNVKGVNDDLEKTSEYPKVKSVRNILQDLEIGENAEYIMKCIEDGGENDTEDSWSTASDSTWETLPTNQTEDFRSACHGILTLLLKERAYRERAETRLEQVEKILNENIINAVDNLRRDVMKLSVLLKEPNIAREEIRRSLSEKDAINNVLEDKMFMLRNHCEQMREQLQDCFNKRDVLEKNNKEMAELLKQNLN